jgi:hypothetical protein
MQIIGQAFRWRYFYKNRSTMKKNIGNFEIMLRLLAAITFGDLAADQAAWG